MELFINKNIQENRADIYLIEKVGNREAFIGYDGEFLVRTDIDPFFPLSDKVKPLLRVSLTLLPDLLKAFGDQTHKEGINTENENLLKGKLQATESHLSDMREITKHLLKIK